MTYFFSSTVLGSRLSVRPYRFIGGGGWGVGMLCERKSFYSFGSIVETVFWSEYVHVVLKLSSNSFLSHFSTC